MSARIRQKVLVSLWFWQVSIKKQERGEGLTCTQGRGSCGWPWNFCGIVRKERASADRGMSKWGHGVWLQVDPCHGGWGRVREPGRRFWKEGRWWSEYSRHRFEMKMKWHLLAMTKLDFDLEGENLQREGNKLRGRCGRYLQPPFMAAPGSQLSWPSWTLGVPWEDRDVLESQMELTLLTAPPNFLFGLKNSLIIILISLMVIWLLNFSITSDHLDILWFFFPRNSPFQQVLRCIIPNILFIFKSIISAIISPLYFQHYFEFSFARAYLCTNISEEQNLLMFVLSIVAELHWFCSFLCSSYLFLSSFLICMLISPVSLSFFF